jgi:hypothetical protein
MLSSRFPSVKEHFFQHSVHTKIHGGQHVYDSLQHLANEVKANADSVPTTIVGGKYGHLVLSVERYAALPLSLTCWVTPVNPGPFALPAGAVAVQIKATHDV